MTILANIIGGAALAALFVVFYALGVSAGREATQQRKEDISMHKMTRLKKTANTCATTNTSVMVTTTACTAR